MDGPPAADQSAGGWTDVTRARPDQAAHRSLFGDVRTPANDARRGKHRREERSGNAHGVQQYCGVELNVGAQGALRMSFGEESFGFAFDRACNRQSVGGGSGALQPRRGAFQCRGAWIADSVDAMPHAHDAATGSQFLFEPVARPFGMTDGVQHIEYGSRRATVERSFERADRGDDGADESRSGGRDNARGER